MRGSLVVLTLAMVAISALSGCSSKTSTATATGTDGQLNTDQAIQDINVKATSTTGIIRGVVVDAAIHPIVGAMVSVQTKEKVLYANTTSNGAFGFGNLQPGTYFVRAHKLGYGDQQASADVKAGDSTPQLTKILLLPDASASRPYAVLDSWKGFLQCGAGEGATNSTPDPTNQVPNGVGVNPCAFTGSDNVHIVIMDRMPTVAQAELVWTNTQSAGDDLSINYFLDGSGTGSFKQKSGTSPVIISANGTEINNANKGDLNLTVRVFPGSSGPAVVVVQQEFTIYTTVFYGFEPRAGWAFSKDGQCSQPSECT